jgi:dienelactone hydrolase
MSSIKQQNKSESEVDIKIDAEADIKAIFCVPQGAQGVVLFAHGSGRFSPRNRYIAEELSANGMAWLLLDLLTEDEEAIDLQTRELRFDIELLAKRVVIATKWLMQNDIARNLKIGYFGSSTGAAAALVAAAQLGNAVGAVVSRGGRPDLAENSLPHVTAPTLLIVGGEDYVVIDLNKSALKKIQAEKKLAIVPDATHLFEEPGKLEEAARLAVEWFLKYLTKSQK